MRVEIISNLCDIISVTKLINKKHLYQIYLASKLASYVNIYTI